MKVTHKINTDLQIREKIPRLAMVQCDHDSRENEITITSLQRFPADMCILQKCKEE